MKESRIEAIDHIHLEASPDVKDDLRWFYGEVAELPAVEWKSERGQGLCFKSERIELRIFLVEHPRIDSVPYRVTLRVSSLEKACEQLEERSMVYQPLSGLSFTDRRVGVCDPAGNRVTLRQAWWYAPV